MRINKRSATKKRKVGGNVLQAAIVPFGLLTIHQWFGSRSVENHSKKHTRKHKKTRKNRK